MAHCEPSVEHRELVDALRTRRPAAASPMPRRPTSPGRPGAPPRRAQTTVIERSEVLSSPTGCRGPGCSGRGPTSRGTRSWSGSRTATGRVGWGETYLVPGARRRVRGRWPTSLVGRDPDDAASDVTSRPGLHRWALGAVSMALDDLRARARGVPVSALYGPRLRDRVRAVCLEPRLCRRPDARRRPGARRRQRLHDDGFRAMKLRIGQYDLDEEIAAIERVVAASPPMTWMADGNGGYDGPESPARLPRLRPSGSAGSKSRCRPTTTRPTHRSRAS